MNNDVFAGKYFVLLYKSSQYDEQYTCHPEQFQMWQDRNTFPIIVPRCIGYEKGITPNTTPGFVTCNNGKPTTLFKLSQNAQHLQLLLIIQFSPHHIYFLYYFENIFLCKV